MSEPSKVIWKYPIIAQHLTLQLPRDAQILCVGVQKGEPQLWVLLHKEDVLVERTIAVYATGLPIDNRPRKYIGTFFLQEAEVVFHVFEE